MKNNIIFLIISLIFLDQFTKVLVHYNMPLYSEIPLISDFLKLYHIQNPGMAFGINFDFKYTKLILSLFRLIASFFIGFYLFRIINKEFDKLTLVCISLIFSGAIGNVIDSVFYGIIFNNAPVSSITSIALSGRNLSFMYFDDSSTADFIDSLVYLTLWYFS